MKRHFYFEHIWAWQSSCVSLGLGFIFPFKDNDTIYIFQIDLLIVRIDIGFGRWYEAKA
jgi:hypothetical protein